jgi:hypothetical protein
MAKFQAHCGRIKQEADDDHPGKPDSHNEKLWKEGRVATSRPALE